MNVDSTSHSQHHSHSSSIGLEREPHFHKIKKGSSRSYSFVENVFKERIQPLYGNQEGALKGIKAGKDRKCELLKKGHDKVGLIVYKKELQNGYANFGVSDSFEIKNLLALNSADHQVENVNQMLLSRIQTLAKSIFAQGIHAVVDINDTTLVDLLMGKGFSVIKKWEEDGNDGGYRLLLSCKLDEKKEIASISTKTKVSEEHSEKKQKPKRIRESSPQIREADEVLQPKKRKGTAKNFEEFRSHVRPRSYSSDYDRSNQPRSSGGYSRDYQGYSTGSTAVANGQYGQPRTREVTLKAKYIHQIKSGQKTIEGRINSGQFRYYRAGEQVRFFYNQNPSDDIRCRVKGVRSYRSFREMLETEGYQKCLADVRSLDEAVRVYDNIPGFVQRATQSGVLAIEVEVI